MSGYFELKSAAGGSFMFNLKAANHQVILTSETYPAKASASGGIESVKKNALDDSRYQRKVAKDNSPVGPRCIGEPVVAMLVGSPKLLTGRHEACSVRIAPFATFGCDLS